LTAPAPRIKGKVDFSGVWQAEPTPVSEFTRMLGADLVKVQVDLAISLSTSSTCFWGIKPEDEPLREGASILNERERAPADRH
jgi:hypothetical protein